MKYKLTKAEQETTINFDNELDTASIYTHDSRLIRKLREPLYSESRREQQRQAARENGLPFMEKGEKEHGKN